MLYVLDAIFFMKKIVSPVNSSTTSYAEVDETKSFIYLCYVC